MHKHLKTPLFKGIIPAVIIFLFAICYFAFSSSDSEAENNEEEEFLVSTPITEDAFESEDKLSDPDSTFTQFNAPSSTAEDSTPPKPFTEPAIQNTASSSLLPRLTQGETSPRVDPSPEQITPYPSKIKSIDPQKTQSTTSVPKQSITKKLPQINPQKTRPQVVKRPQIKLALRQDNKVKRPKINFETGEINIPKQESIKKKVTSTPERKNTLSNPALTSLVAMQSSSNPKIRSRSQHKVSVSLFEDFCIETGKSKPARPDIGDTAFVTYSDASIFLQWLTKKHQTSKLIESNEFYRLPSSLEVASSSIWLLDKPQKGVKSFGFVLVRY